MKILILGASGMLGNALFRFLSEYSTWNVYGTLRNPSCRTLFSASHQPFLKFGVDVENNDSLVNVLNSVKPDVVINCIGLIKQNSSAEDPLHAIPINSMLPHRIAKLSSLINARFIHFSTDCVFAGKKGMYKEEDSPDATDLYGRSKLLGEVTYLNTLTLRTSIIGHELIGKKSLLGWFLSQNGDVHGYQNAIFSGLPTVEISRIIRDHILTNYKLQGLYHLSANPISKYDLLIKIANVYNKKINIIPYKDLIIDRSLDSSKFKHETGYIVKPWDELIRSMKDFG